MSVPIWLPVALVMQANCERLKGMGVIDKGIFFHPILLSRYLSSIFLCLKKIPFLPPPPLKLTINIPLPALVSFMSFNARDLNKCINDKSCHFSIVY